MTTDRYVSEFYPPCICANSRWFADGVGGRSSFAFEKCTVNQELDSPSWFSTRILQLKASIFSSAAGTYPVGISFLARPELWIWDLGSSPPHCYHILVLIIRILILATLSHTYTLGAQVSSSNWPRSVHQTSLSLATDLRYSRSTSSSATNIKTADIKVHVGRSADDDNDERRLSTIVQPLSTIKLPSGIHVCVNVNISSLDLERTGMLHQKSLHTWQHIGMCTSL